MQLLSIIWNVDPVIFHIGSFGVRYYGIAWALTFAIGLWLFDKFVKRENLNPKLLDSIFWYGVISTIVGARLGHCFFYDAAEYLSNPISILYIWQGGLASHGAAIGLLVGLWLFSRKNKIPYIWSLDRIMIVVTIGGALVRLGNLFNSEIYGHATNLPWGFVFVKTNPPETIAMHPTQIYEAACYLIGFFILRWLYFKKDTANRHPGFIFGLGIMIVFATRFLIEFVKNPQEAFEATMTLNMGQWLSIPFVIAGGVVMWLAMKNKIKYFAPEAKPNNKTHKKRK